MTWTTTLEEAGCQLDASTVIFTVEPVLFRRTLGNKLRSQSNGYEQFMSELQDYTEDADIFRKFLLPSMLADQVPKAGRTSNSESMFKTLLAIDAIQPEIIVYLLERLPEFYDALEQDNSSSCTARLILNQLRWLDYIANPEQLTGKLIEIISITPSVIQHEIITSLPDMINDSEHKPIVVYLKELMNENPELTVPILDALSNLTLHSESLDDVRETVLDRLESAEMDDLAVIVKFMLQIAKPDTIDMVIYGIRQKLDFRALGKVQPTQSKRSKDQVPEALILESIKLGLQFHKFVCDAWFKAIVALESQREHKVIDMLVLIILYSMASMKKKTEVLIRKKISTASITASLIQETIACHADGLSGYWGTLLSLSESLLRSCQQHNVISPFASSLYYNSFKASDVYYKQEIIGALVTHIGSGVEAEMNVALSVLLNLATSDVKSVATYSVFVKGILDYLDNLDLHQIRTLFDIFSLLALTTGNAADSSANLWSEIQIVIRKQLSNPKEKYKNIGIVACLSVVKVLGSPKLCNEAMVGGSSSVQRPKASHINTIMRHPTLRQATNLLDLGTRSSKEHANCITLLYDELAHMLSEGDIDERLQLWIKESLTTNFTEYYIVAKDDAEEYIKEVRNDPYKKLVPEIKCMLDVDDDESGITINMFHAMYRSNVRIKKIQMVPMCSLFNLMQMCEKKINGNLSDVDALFGCGVILFNTEEMQEMTAEEAEYASDMLFYTINWFREILNSFVFSKEDSTRLLARLRHVLEMEDMLQTLLSQVTRYAPLEFHTTVSSTDRNRPLAMTSTPLSVTSQEGGTPTSHDHPKTIKKDLKSNTITFGSVNELRPYMRAFHVDILELLNYNEDLQDTEMKLSWFEINYLLKDLDQKLDIKIVPPAPVIFGKKKVTTEHYTTCNATLLARTTAQQLTKKVLVYVPSLLQTLENVNGELQSMDIEPGRIKEETEEIAQTMAYILTILLKLLQWPDIQNSDNNMLLQGLVQALASRISGGKSNSLHSFEAELRLACEYMSQYIETIPQVNTALTLFHILQRLVVFAEQPSSFKSITFTVIDHIMKTAWFDWRDIKKQIPTLLEQWIESSQVPLDVLSDLVNTVLPQFDEQGAMEAYPLLNNETIVSHYQAVLNQTVKSFALLQNTDGEPEVILVENARIVRIFERITHYVKVKEQGQLLGLLLKSGRLFIEAFTNHSIPYFTKIFKTHTTSIVAIFKDFQSSTRMLQIVCSHVKVLKDIRLSSFVPPLKKSLEIVIYQVKMLLIENHIPANAFYMGALKHRDMRGAEISSQIPRQEEEEDEMMEELDTIQEEEEEEEQETRVAQKARKKSAPAKRKPSKPKKSSLADQVNKQYRSASIVPSSDEEEEGESLPALNRKRVIMDDEAEEGQEDEEEEDTKEEVMEINFDSDEEEEDDNELPPLPTDDKENEDEEDEDELPSLPSSYSRSTSKSGNVAKKRKILRCGLGVPQRSTTSKLFDLSKR